MDAMEKTETSAYRVHVVSKEKKAWLVLWVGYSQKTSFIHQKCIKYHQSIIFQAQRAYLELTVITAHLQHASTGCRKKTRRVHTISGRLREFQVFSAFDQLYNRFKLSCHFQSRQAILRNLEQSSSRKKTTWDCNALQPAFHPRRYLGNELTAMSSTGASGKTTQRSANRLTSRKSIESTWERTFASLITPSRRAPSSTSRSKCIVS